MTQARAGVRCERQTSSPDAEVDLLAAADWMFPNQMDHHTLLTGNGVANRLLVRLVRQMGGSGTLPDVPPAAVPSVRDEIVDVCIVGAGPAGLTAATTLARLAPRADVLLVDEQAEPGGSWLAEPQGFVRATAAAERAMAAGVRLLSRAPAIGFFPEDVVDRGQGRADNVGDREDAITGILAVSTANGLCRVAARRILYATGAYDQNFPFQDNDRPGVISARACGRLAFRHGIRPGRRIAIVGPSTYGDRLAAGLVDAGLRPEHVERVDPRADHPVAARGATTLRGLIVADGAGRERRLAADVIAVAATPAPASELPRQHGAHVRMDEARGGFAVTTNERFSTTAERVFCCGDVTGYGGPALAEQAGAAAAAAIAHTLNQDHT